MREILNIEAMYLYFYPFFALVKQIIKPNEAII